jgi:hypothetical protein
VLTLLSNILHAGNAQRSLSGTIEEPAKKLHWRMCLRLFSFSDVGIGQVKIFPAMLLFLDGLLIQFSVGI